MRGLSGAFLRYRVMAWVTGVVLAVAFTWMCVLIVQWMVDGNSFSSFFPDYEGSGAYSLLWIAHGWLYLLYLIAAVDLAFRVRYGVLRTVALLLAGTIPFASFVAEALVHRALVREGRLPARTP